MNLQTQTTNKVRTASRWRTLFLAALIGTFFACGGNNTNTQNSNGTHVFRKANFGMSAAQVKRSETETVKLTEDTPEKLAYTADMGEDDFTDIIYHFNGADELIEIEFNLYFDSSSDAESIHAGLMSQFDADYKRTGDNSWAGKASNTDFQVFTRRSESTTKPGLYVIWQPL